MCQTWHDNHGTWKWGRITILRLFLMVCFWFCFWKYECYLQEWKSSPAWQLLILTDLSISIVLWTVKGTEYHPISPWQPCTSSLHTLESLFLPCYLPLKGMLEFFGPLRSIFEPTVHFSGLQQGRSSYTKACTQHGRGIAGGSAPCNQPTEK